jgi:hypothetical protein
MCSDPQRSRLVDRAKAGPTRPPALHRGYRCGLRFKIPAHWHLSASPNARVRRLCPIPARSTDPPADKKPRFLRGFLIGAPGFEPGTSPTRTVRATRLRHAPIRPVSQDPALVPGERPSRTQELARARDRDFRHGYGRDSRHADLLGQLRERRRTGDLLDDAGYGLTNLFDHAGYGLSDLFDHAGHWLTDLLHHA